MKIDSCMFGDVVVLTLTGELDSRGNQLLDKTLKDVGQNGIFKVVLDISALRFMGNQTVSLLLSNLKDIRAGGGNIKLLNPQRTVHQYLKQNRMIELFEIHSSRAEAVRSFEESVPRNKSPERSGSTAHPAQGGETAMTPSLDTSEADIGSRFQTGEILYANSCMLATLIKRLEAKGMLTAEEAGELMDYERLSLKGVVE